MSRKISKELSKHRISQAREDLEASKFLYSGKFYKSANRLIPIQENSLLTK